MAGLRKRSLSKIPLGKMGEIGAWLREMRDEKLHINTDQNFYNACFLDFGLMPRQVDQAMNHGFSIPEKREPERITIEPVVYFIGAADMVKIGFTISISKRMTEISLMSPIPLTLLGSLVGGRKKEQELHIRFKQYRRRGEWFELSDEIKEFINANAVIPKQPSKCTCPHCGRPKP